MKLKKRIGIIGLGNMGSAILKGIIKKTIFPKTKITGFDKDIKKVKKIRNMGIHISMGNKELVNSSDIVIFAIKPQEVKEVLGEIHPFINKNKLIISILAGVKTLYIEKFAGKARVVRIMPNIAITIGEGVSAISKGKYANSSDVKITEKIFSAMGKTFIVDESLMDLITAISGSGPAYFFEIVEYLCLAAKKLGLSENISRKLVIQTAKGAVEMLCRNPDPSFLTASVTSKKGTTIKALSVIRKMGVKGILFKAISAAKKRAGQLSPS